jgi:hypothetical protein
MRFRSGHLSDGPSHSEVFGGDTERKSELSQDAPCWAGLPLLELGYGSGRDSRVRGKGGSLESLESSRHRQALPIEVDDRAVCTPPSCCRELVRFAAHLNSSTDGLIFSRILGFGSSSASKSAESVGGTGEEWGDNMPSSVSSSHNGRLTATQGLGPISGMPSQPAVSPVDSWPLHTRNTSE